MAMDSAEACLRRRRPLFKVLPMLVAATGAQLQFGQGALAGDRMGERSQLVRRLESEALAMANGAQLRQGGPGARPASSPPRRPGTAPSLASLGGSPAL